MEFRGNLGAKYPGKKPQEDDLKKGKKPQEDAESEDAQSEDISEDSNDDIKYETDDEDDVSLEEEVFNFYGKEVTIKNTKKRPAESATETGAKCPGKKPREDDLKKGKKPQEDAESEDAESEDKSEDAESEDKSEDAESEDKSEDSNDDIKYENEDEDDVGLEEEVGKFSGKEVTIKNTRKRPAESATETGAKYPRKKPREDDLNKGKKPQEDAESEDAESEDKSEDISEDSNDDIKYETDDADDVSLEEEVVNFYGKEVTIKNTRKGPAESATETGGDNKVYCTACGKKFNSYDAMHSHSKAKHSGCN